jgi:hypothetical protein
MRAYRRAIRPTLLVAVALLWLSSLPWAATGASDLTFELTPSASSLQVGQALSVAIVEHAIPATCDFYAHDLTLLATSGIAPVLAFDSPAKVGPPVGATTSFTLTAKTPGVAQLRASIFGEVYCGGWAWAYRSSNIVTVTVAGEPHFMFLPLISS